MGTSESMNWVDSVIWWQVYPLGFAGAPKEAPADDVVQHRLPGHQWLDYLIELGCNGLALGPIFASETHGYDSVDLTRLDPRLGDDHDFDTLVQQCRDRGIRVDGGDRRLRHQLRQRAHRRGAQQRGGAVASRIFSLRRINYCACGLQRDERDQRRWAPQPTRAD